MIRVEEFKTRPVLVVEDDPDISEIIQFSLQEEGHRTLSAGNGRIALNIINNCPTEDVPFLIMLDHLMPEMDGLTTLGELKKHPVGKNIPVIFISGYENPNLGKMIVAGKIKKPFDIQEVIQTVGFYSANSFSRDSMIF